MKRTHGLDEREMELVITSIICFIVLFLLGLLFDYWTFARKNTVIGHLWYYAHIYEKKNKSSANAYT